MPELLVVSETEQVIVTDETTTLLEVNAQGPIGPQGPPGSSGGALLVLNAATPLASYMAIAVNAAGAAIYADSSIPSHGLVQVGVSVQSASAGDPLNVAVSEIVEHSGWTFAVGPVFLGLAGQLVQTLPGGAVFSKVVGWALAPTRLLVRPQPPIYLP